MTEIHGGERNDSPSGRTLLIVVTVIVLLLQAIKLGSRKLLLGQWPAAGQWGQLCLVVWLVYSLWEGKGWARITMAVYYTLATLIAALGLLVAWWRMNVGLRWVTLAILLLAAIVSAILWFSAALRAHLAERRAAAGE